MRTTVITTVAGRHEHLARQRALLRGDHHVVVAMGDGEADRCRAFCGDRADVIEVPGRPDGLPLAQARNAGAGRALEAGAQLLVFLDVDCLPGPALLRRYREAATSAGGADALLCGPVAYLPPAPSGGYPLDELEALGSAHPARPVPPEDALLHGGDHTLFWTLSFALTAATWRRIGGFCEDYVGYGGEDTDYGQLALRAGVDLCWVGGAWAYHQHHPVQSPPVNHLHDILRNAAIFHRRWGWWPMGGWLEAFAERGLAYLDAETGCWVSRTAGRTLLSPSG